MPCKSSVSSVSASNTELAFTLWLKASSRSTLGEASIRLPSPFEKKSTMLAAYMPSASFFVHKHEAHLDGESSSRVLDAVNNYIWYFQGKTRTKPWNLVRKFKLRWRVGYPLMATLRLW